MPFTAITSSTTHAAKATCVAAAISTAKAAKHSARVATTATV